MVNLSGTHLCSLQVLTVLKSASFLEGILAFPERLHYACFELFALGQQFGCDMLSDKACHLIDTFHVRSAAVFQRAIREDTLVNHSTGDLRSGMFPTALFFRVAASLYDMSEPEMDALRQRFTSFFKMCLYVPITLPSFQRGLRLVPGLAADLLCDIGLTTNCVNLEGRLPLECHQCCQRVLQGQDENMFIEVWIRPRGEIVGICLHCSLEDDPTWFNAPRGMVHSLTNALRESNFPNKEDET